MKKYFLLAALILTGFCRMEAQVGINTTSPHQSAALDIESTNKGMLIPRMTTAQKVAVINPAPGLLIYDTTLRCISQNAGTAVSPAWVCLSQKDAQNGFFYMPTIAVDASTVSTGKTLDLYDEYKKQFTAPTKNPSAPVNIPYFSNRTDLYYYITSYDTNVLANISINNNGVMTYDIKAESDYDSFMTVVFVVK
ncbi:hypothetical protein G7050_12215 [Dysgonomonas sp. HDW5A]|uniref:hypothetical protein n=1 Tax=Dysgonomonas sp. HDW5A TaxID=2714926 RepID=UPI001408FBF1|nr:hypothetical protein [Dysgonomonas sp. HDW5A]QIK60552.1 hypothetical protein G7050_12215 [Dysgonomonas sp. HDW5A]